MTEQDRSPLALVLSGGGARGAYEIGVLRYALGTLGQGLGDRARPRIFCGTSVGAINACALAGGFDLDDLGLKRVADRWSALRVEDVFRLGWGDLASLAGWLLGRESQNGPMSILDAAPLADMVRTVIPWRSLHQRVAEGRVIGVTVSATDVENGHTVVFVQTERQIANRPRDVDWTPTRLTAQHALASAATPIVFPAVRVAGRVYTDGSLRHNTPLAPALRLGAGRVFVVGLRTRAAPREGRQDATDQRAYASPLYLFGRVLNALTLDRVENDLANLRQVNKALAKLDPNALGEEPVAGALHAAGGGLRPVQDFFIRPSKDLGRLAAEMLQRPAVRARLAGPAGYLLRRLGDMEGGKEPSDLVSYLLFDGEYAAELLSLGESDARAHKDELEEFLASGPRED